jgi:predicted house-cleaning noncanonical NTP pyrophosphatase (MazG superfamily)
VTRAGVAAAKRQIARKGNPALEDAARFGAKAAGLAWLDPGWTPRFFALEAGAHMRLTLDEDLRHAMAAALISLGVCSDGVIVRSSALGETLDKRGIFDSARAAGAASEVVSCILELAAKAPELSRSQLGFIVQEWLGGAATGHLSNERRVSRESRGWLCEAELPIEGEDKSFRFRVDSKTRGREDLSCSSWEELAAAIRTVARQMHKDGGRYHLEWVWDGSRVWVVQCDPARVERGSPPGSAWIEDETAPPLGDLRRFKRVPAEPNPFPKVNHVREFRSCGLPSGDIRVLAGTTVIGRLARGEISRELRRDLSELIEAPIVVRTDFRSAIQQPKFLSKRTDTCLTYEQLEAFLIDTAKTVVAGGCSPGDLAFITHRFMLARAGAMSFARHGSTRVRVDATWGLPDSLLFYPHDSFRVDVATKHVERYLRCKTDYIDVAEDGKWRSHAAGSDWDWRPTLTNEEAIRIGEMTVHLADHVGADIEVMFFIGGKKPGESILPWFFDANERHVTDVHTAPGFYVGERVTITNRADLQALDVELGTSGGNRRLIVCLRPTMELLRSREFILEVADVAKRRGVPIELEGSELSHAYYVLEDAGAAIRCRNPWRPPDRRRSFGKLVRDFVPVKIERRGEFATTYSADRTELKELIKAKVIEEAFEYYWSPDADTDVEELADLLELLRTAARVHGIDFSVVVQTAEAKLEERGGFESGVVLVETRNTPDDSSPRWDESRRGRLITVPVAASTRRRANSARRVVRLPGGRLILPVAPPTGWKVGEARTVGLTAEDEVTVTYGPTEILVHLQPRSTGRNRYQLPLFDPTAEIR